MSRARRRACRYTIDIAPSRLHPSLLPPASHLPPTALTHTHRYSDSECMVHSTVTPGSGMPSMDSLADFILPAGAEVCVAETGSLAGKYSKIIADSTGVTLSQHTAADCTGTAAGTIKITPGKCTLLSAAYSNGGIATYAYLGGSPGACEAGVFKGNCPPTASAATAGLSITALAGLAAVAIANFV